MEPITHHAWHPPARTRAPQRWTESASGLLVPDTAAEAEPEPTPLAVDLFAGAGGSALGLVNAGYHVIGALETDADAAITYMVNLARYGECTLHFESAEREKRFGAALERINAAEGLDTELYANATTAGAGYIAKHPGLRSCEHLWVWDARTMTGERMLDDLGLEPGDLALVAAGPPCQGFSVAGRRNVMDPRNTLVFEAARLINELAPASFMIENVPGIQTMTTPQGTRVVDTLAAMFVRGGWGSMKALRAALDDNASARGVVRPARRARDAEDESTDEPVQTTLF